MFGLVWSAAISIKFTKQSMMQTTFTLLMATYLDNLKIVYIFSQPASWLIKSISWDLRLFFFVCLSVGAIYFTGSRKIQITLFTLLLNFFYYKYKLSM